MREVQTLCTSVNYPESKISTCSKTVLVDICHKNSNKLFTCHCIVDEQSISCLIDPSLIDYFNVDCPNVSYILTMLDGIKQNVSGKIVSGFEVRGHYEGEWITLPNMFSNSSIPDTKSEIATKAIVQNHPHIAHLSHKFPEFVPDYPVLLLVGSNCGPAMATKVHGDHAPFAHEMSLGYAVVGPVAPGNDGTDTGCLVLRSSLEHEHVESKISFDQLNFDGLLSNVDDELPGLSQNDRKFNEIINNSITVRSDGNLQMDLPLCDSVPFPDNSYAVHKRTFNTCLLYTSPSPRDKRQSRMPSSA